MSVIKETLHERKLCIEENISSYEERVKQDEQSLIKSKSRLESLKKDLNEIVEFCEKNNIVLDGKEEN
jgi:phosphosulfolactate phosphohydrolase-like enzyme